MSPIYMNEPSSEQQSCELQVYKGGGNFEEGHVTLTMPKGDPPTRTTPEPPTRCEVLHLPLIKSPVHRSYLEENLRS